MIQDRIENEYNEVCTGCSNQEFRNVFANRNFEKLGERYSYAQMSVRYFMISTNSRSENSGSFAEVMHDQRQKLLEESGLDVNSCLQFLLDYYTQFVDPNVSNMHLICIGGNYFIVLFKKGNSSEIKHFY